MSAQQQTSDWQQAPAGDPAGRRLPPLLRQAWYGLNQAFRRRIAHLGITPDQFTALRWLHEQETDAMNQRALTNLMASDPNTIATMLGRMERDGLIERRPHANDRRANCVLLKSLGRKVFADARPLALDLQTEVLEALSSSDRGQFLAFLEQIAGAASEAAKQLSSSPRRQQ